VLRDSRPPGAAWTTWRNWDVLARQMFQEARAAGGIYHLWGHSWEIEAHGDWVRLRGLLRYIAGHDGVTFLTNGELAGRLCGQ
jgi:peptidoglycan-N-acetylglucosamine deacetylase